MSDSTRRWHALQELYHSALEHTPSGRDAFLREACADEALRSEVISLLQARSAGEGLLERPDLGCAMPTLETGASIGVYRIERRIGSGGMGEVYCATDTRLHRRVAIKVLSSVYATDCEWIARFQREARVLASLNHPHITSIYGLEESGGVCALVMELAEGPTLAARMARGPISVKDALALAKQIAEALEYAHEKGIIHRDLKPANVKIATEGGVKVLDFGLAKATQPVSPEDSPVDDETATAKPTKVGAILGTPGYMSPEQATGAVIDQRADIWAFGVVLFEILTGRRLYTGTSVTDALAAAIRDEPRWDELPGETPAAIRRLLKRCLEKDPKRRLRDIGEARIALEDCLAGKSDIQEPQPASKRPLPGWAVAAVLVVAVAAVGVGFTRWRVPARSIPAQTVRYRISLPGHFTIPESQGFSLSPDGQTLAFLASSDKGRGVWVQPINALEPRFLPGTGSSAPPPFWSPDSRFLVFNSEGKLKKVDLIGGPPVTICSTPGIGLGGAWSRAGAIIFGTLTSGIMRVPETGGDAVPLTVLDRRKERMHGGPTFLPDGRHFVYSRVSNVVENSGIYVGSLDGAPGEQSLKQLVATPYFAQVVAQSDGNASLLFLRDDTLWMQELDTSRLALKGDPLRVADHIGHFRAGSFFSATTGEALVYRGPRELPQMAWFDRNGKRIADVGDPVDLDSAPVLSPDGTRIAFSLFEAASVNLWVLDLARGIRTRLTTEPALESAVLWSPPDGKRLVFSSARDGHYDLYQKAANGEGSEELLYSANDNKWATSWSPDGRFLAYETRAAATKRDIWILPLDGTGKPTAAPLLRTAADEASGSFCPTGRWFAYESDYSGQHEVYIQEFAPAAAGYLTGPPIQVSKGGGWNPHWQFGGKELFYVAPDHTLMSVALPRGPALKPGIPQRLFSRPQSWLGEADSDGKRFLFAVPKEQSAPQPFTVVLNWQAELKK